MQSGRNKHITSVVKSVFSTTTPVMHQPFAASPDQTSSYPNTQVNRVRDPTHFSFNTNSQVVTRQDPNYRTPLYTYGNSARGPAMWHLIKLAYRPCFTRDSTDLQSPINIRLRNVQYDSSQNTRNISVTYNGGDGPTLAIFYNDGRVPTLHFPSSDRRISGVAPHTRDQYLMTSLRVHFGGERRGSEHTVNNRYFDGELQFVHYNEKYADMEAASQYQDGIVIVSTFLQEDTSVNSSQLSWTLSHAEHIKYPGESVSLTTTISGLLPYEPFNKYVYYRGSLTSPPCTRGVTWLLLSEPVPVPKTAVQKLRSLYADKSGSVTIGTHGNARPLQPINGRSIRANFRILL